MDGEPEGQALRSLLRQGWEMSGRGQRYAAGIAWATGIDAWSEVLARSGLHAGNRVVEIGSGPGLLAAASVHLGNGAIAVDWSREMLFTAHPNGGLVHLIADAAALPVRDGSAHAIVGRAILWCMSEPAEVLAECCRVLASSGLIVLAEPIFERPDERSELEQSLLRLNVRRQEALGGLADAVAVAETTLSRLQWSPTRWDEEFRLRGFMTQMTEWDGLATAGGPDRYNVLTARR